VRSWSNFTAMHSHASWPISSFTPEKMSNSNDFRELLGGHIITYASREWGAITVTIPDSLDACRRILQEGSSSLADALAALCGVSLFLDDSNRARAELVIDNGIIRYLFVGTSQSPLDFQILSLQIWAQITLHRADAIVTASEDSFSIIASFIGSPDDDAREAAAACIGNIVAAAPMLHARKFMSIPSVVRGL
jgi:hypothetical protein